MQTRWFELWVGTWPTAIDWTGAVVNTFVVASLESFSELLFPPSHDHVGERHEDHENHEDHKDRELREDHETYDRWAVENELNLYFSQSTAYYFGENVFSIRNQAYDDMLWVVLGWLDAVKFVNSHARRQCRYVTSIQPWHGAQYTNAFAHRARVFYELARRGWDESLCGGGMMWNPSLEPYKNAITNQLFIAASVGMYLHFPGDCNGSPFVVSDARSARLPLITPHEPQFRRAAVDAYDWLKRSNMTNHQGLYVDGFHVTGWNRNGSVGTGKCDERNEMVYTYNQAVILTGLRGLWESTGDQTYLEDAHRLVRNTLRATGWSLDTAQASGNSSWAGLGRDGILEDFCDHMGTCNQDGQIFKGIYFHHLVHFCQPLPSQALVPGLTAVADKDTALLHQQSCREYAPWVVRNAQAAMATRDDNGRFGGWWGAREEWEEKIGTPTGAVDYRNGDHHASLELERGRWRVPHGHLSSSDRSSRENDQPYFGAGVFEDVSRSTSEDDAWLSSRSSESIVPKGDLNDRGRGRTLETQAAGVAVVRALWEFLDKAA